MTCRQAWSEVEACLTAEWGDGSVDGLDENAFTVKLHGDGR